MRAELTGRAQFRALGPVEVRSGQRWQLIDDVERRSLLSCLLVRPGELVPIETMAAAVWGDAPPDMAGNLISIHVQRLRRLIGDPDGRVLAGRAPGYQLLVGLGDLDLLQFEALVEDGRSALEAGSPATAGILLAEALRLWRGPALADVRPTAFLSAQAQRLADLRVTAAELRARADLDCGRAAQLIPELQRLAADNPSREGPRLLLARALDEADRHPGAPGAVTGTIPDSPGSRLCPDPLTAQTAAELVAVLSRFRVWAGEPSFQDMRRLSEPTTAASTMCKALGGSTLPSLRVVRAIVTGCGGTPEQLQAFATAWRRIRLAPGQAGGQPDPPAGRALYSVRGTGTGQPGTARAEPPGPGRSSPDLRLA